jgi:ribosomal protein L11 methyltransferase
MSSRLKYSRLFVPRKARDDSVVGLLSLHGPLGFAEEGRDLVACFREAESARRANRDLAARGVRAELVTDIPEGDPLEAFRAASRPFAVGRKLWIDPGDPSGASAPAGRIALKVPASRAFGTGGHASTRLALLALEDESLAGASVLDVGTGSAVLALAAVALGAESAFGFDVDADAVFVARRNLRLNGADGRVRLFVGGPASVAGRFRVVVANLLPGELLAIRGPVAARVATGGHLIVSGIPGEEESEVMRRLRGRRWRLASRRTEEDWTCVCLERG